MKIEVHLPWPKLDGVSASLRYLAKKATEAGHDGSWFSGYDRGADVNNEVFEMYVFREDCDCTCGQSEPKHSDECRRKWSEWGSARMSDRKGDGWGVPLFVTGKAAKRDEAWVAAHPHPGCTCGGEAAWLEKEGLAEVPHDGWRLGTKPSNYTHEYMCLYSIAGRPEFTYKPTGLTAHWYKSIGRDFSVTPEPTEEAWNTILAACLVSIGAKPVTWREALIEMERDLGEERAAFQRALDAFGKP